jgi:hypothetical protein
METQQAPAIETKPAMMAKPIRFLVVSRRGTVDKEFAEQTTAEAMIQRQLGDFHEKASAWSSGDRAVFFGETIIAVIRRGPDGRPEVTRFAR